MKHTKMTSVTCPFGIKHEYWHKHDMTSTSHVSLTLVLMLYFTAILCIILCDNTSHVTLTSLITLYISTILLCYAISW